MKTSSKFSLIVITCFVLISMLLIGCVSAEDDSMQKQKPPKPLWDKINGMEYLTKPERITPIIKVTKESKITEQEQKDYDKVYDLIHNGKNFESELIKFEKKYKTSPNVEMLYYNVVEYLYYNRPGKKHKTVIDWCKKYFKKFPDGKYYQTVATYYNNARGISLELYTQASFLPGDEAGVFLNVRKIKSVEFEVYKIDVKDINVPFQQIDPYGFKLTKDNQVKKIYKKLKGDFYGTITLGKLDSGLYVVKATVPGEDLVAATIVSVSRLGVISKSDKEKTVLFVVDKITGAPVENAKITGFKSGFIVARGKTNKDGITFLKRKEKENYNNMDFKILKGDELTFINVYNYYYGYGNSKFKTYFYADRPVYRPAQKVFFKVIFREKIDTLKFSIPEDTSFKIVIEKPSGAKIYDKVLKTNEFGSVNDHIELEEEAELGWYRYKIFNSDGTQLSGYYGVNAFRVEEYKKPEFKMTVKSNKSSYVIGEEIEVDVDVKYYFGEVVKNGAVEYKIEYAKHYIPYWYYYPFSWYYEDQSYGYGYKEFYLEGKTKTDSNGKCKIKFKAKDLPYDANYTVRVRVTDKSRRMIEGSASIKVAQAQFSITMTTDSYIYKPGNKVKLNFKGKDITGKPVPFEGEIKITKYVWRSKKSEYIEILTDKIKTQSSGSGIYEFTPDEKGNFYATITAKDKNGRKITAQRNFYVADSSYREYFNFSSIDIIFDKDFYDIGDKGSAVIQSPFKEGWALVTYEGDSIIDYKVVKLNSSSTVIDFNVLDEHSPNFYFSVTIIKDNKINSKVKNLVVPPKKKFLSINVNSDKKTYKPGEDAEFKITVKDGNGKPVICELSMGVVDASLYYIQEE
ncbi:hypothetical protein KAU33_14485, partial [Candidatus Dependentiae bacterium]|nr:hypothetical protein [Candidatus Dependentiae bacterium]